MKTTARTIALFASFLFTTAFLYPQQRQPFNQNAPGSSPSPTIGKAGNGNWSFELGTGASFGLKSNETTLFRGNSMTTKMSGHYYFGNIGLGVTTGITPGTMSSNAVNKFIADRKFPQDQLQISKINPFNSYFLFGPSFRFGGKVYVSGDLQAGLFVNNPGGLNIVQQGSARSIYRFDGGEKNIFPGFSGSVSINYPLNRTTHFFINTDYLQSKSSIRLFDPQGGIDIPTQVNRDVKLLTAGVGIIKSFGRRHETPGGMAAGRKHIGNVKYEEIKAAGRIIDPENNSGIVLSRDAQSGLATGRRYRPGQPVYGNISSRPNENCGPVTLTSTNPDGTIEQRTFACPADAAQYNQRISMNVTTPKQTQGATFGEKVSAGLHAPGNAVAQGTARGFISGTLLWASDNPTGIVTNEMAAVSSVSTLSGGHGGAASASYAATGRMNNEEGLQVVVATLYSRESASGMATGKRQYQPVYNEENNSTCTDCAVTAKLIAHELTHVVQQSGGSAKSGIKEGRLCGNTTHFFVTLNNADNGQPVAKTKPDSCGNFWFDNIPVGDYIIRVKGEVVVQKDYQVNINSEGKYDVAGELLAGDDQLIVQLDNKKNDSGNQSAKVIVRGWNPEKKELITDYTDKNLPPGLLTGGAILSSAFIAGTPIGGVIVKGGKNPGGNLRTIQTNEYGEFEFAGLEKGNYTISAELKYTIDEAAILIIGPDAAENIVTSESNLKNEVARKGWDGTIKGSIDNESIQPQLKAQNNNTVRSNRTELHSILVEADLDGDGKYETEVTSKITDEILIDENANEITPAQKAGVSTSRSNIRNRSALQMISDGLYISYGTAIVNGREVFVKSVLKAKHDTAKNAIGNIR
ncbi:MAG: hypothetical protein JSS70_07475 [Bacteroidetes bacterium]|nr:hypothetical protein [Bacteroidota bacterium]